MSLKWYPVIDYVSCIECGTCSTFCKHGVYDKSKSPVPLVIYPEGCIDQCHGCQNKCPVSAISYVGDTNSSLPNNSCDCGGNCCS